MKEESTGMVLALTRRYQDGYLAANSVIGFGAIIKAMAFVIGGAVLVGGLALNDRFSTFAGLILAATLWGFIYFFGVGIAAQGQILRATLDAAVNSSPFLQDDEKAKAMRLSLAGKPGSANGLLREAGYRPAEAETQSEREYYQGGSVDTVLCRHCGTTVHHLAATCRNCGGKL